jgi:hypothetical protein
MIIIELKLAYVAGIHPDDISVQALEYLNHLLFIRSP